jgi:hypothetical protein
VLEIWDFEICPREAGMVSIGLPGKVD